MPMLGWSSEFRNGSTSGGGAALRAISLLSTKAIKLLIDVVKGVLNANFRSFSFELKKT